MKKTGKTTMWLMALGLGVSMPMAALAAPGGGPDDGPGARDGSGEGRGEHRGRLKEMHARLLKEKVGLDDARVAKVQAVTQQFRTQKKGLRQDMRAARESLKILVETHSNDDRAFSKAIAQVRATRAKLQQLRQDEQDAVANLLSPREQATLMVTMQKVRKHHGARGRGGRDGERGEWGGRHGGRGHGPDNGADVFEADDE